MWAWSANDDLSNVGNGADCREAEQEESEEVVEGCEQDRNGERVSDPVA